MSVRKNNCAFWFKRLFEPKKQSSVEAESLYMMMGELADKMNKTAKQKHNKPLCALYGRCKGLFYK